MISAKRCTSNYPCFFPPTYAFEQFLPVINLRLVAFWLSSATTGCGRMLLVRVWLAILSGWMFTAAVAAGIGRLVSQQD